MQKNLLPLIVKRSEEGPYMKEADFERALSKRTAELVKQYGLKFNPQTPVPWDDNMADRLYQAGLDLFVDLGAYNQTTERRILFSRAEVEELVALARSSLVLGTGKDAVVMRHRAVEGHTPAVVLSGPTGTPCSEKYHPLILLSCAQEPLVDMLGAGSVSTYMGNQIIPGTPLEILGARRDAFVAREALRKAGRPGMHISDVAVPLTCQGKIAAVDFENGLRPSDAFLVSQMVELKTSYDQLSRVAYLQSIGMHIVDLMTPLIGGLGGGAEGTAVVTIACHILGVVLYDASYHMMSHTHMRFVNNTDRMGLWMQSMVGQALSRNTPMPGLNDIYCVSGAGAEELLWEVAAGAVAGTPSGMNMQGAGCTGGFKADHTSGLEARFIAEVSHACLGITRQQANELVLELLSHYEKTFVDPNRGLPFPEVYDENTVEPKEAWLEKYHVVREAIIKIGLDLDGGWRKVKRG
ncbi:MAG TPA: monomethylamine:corrinoid methyltransferase [Anaerolineales bacterium]|nr:monomethylamine:corrinoid methyltransferase [Anaerolineales bacterium]